MENGQFRNFFSKKAMEVEQIEKIYKSISQVSSVYLDSKL